MTKNNAKKKRLPLLFFLNIAAISITNVLVFLCVKLHFWRYIDTVSSFV